ncbi:MAG TPA: DNA modification methylase [Clostridiales bacterium]|nr:MAG: lactate dehydrogenase [Clostridiales bacterium GWD2_32_59]HAN09376.1 DNA modification methylase [Clostridiales bacterium]
MQTNVETKKIKVEQLKAATYNPRKNLRPGDIEYEKIKNSIQVFGYVDPVIINSDLTIIGGHQRVKVLKDLGYDEIDCVIVDVDKDREKALNIALNKITGEWDNEKLEELLRELSIVNMAEITGFDIAEINDILGEEGEVQEDDFNLEENIPEEPISQKGDVWLLGRHRLKCGDSTNENDVTDLMNGQKTKLTITDPPYNVNYEGSNGMKIQNDNMESNQFYLFLFDAYKRMFEVSEEGAPIYVFHADGEGVSFRKAFTDAGFKLTQCLIWVKNAFVMCRQDYHWRHEPILYGWKEGAAHSWYGHRNKDTILDLNDDSVDIKKLNKQELVSLVKAIRQTMAEETTVIYNEKPTKNDIHPTMKPLKLIGKLMSNSSRKGDNVFDPFGGSGSTLMSAEQLGRTCFTMEYDECYCDAIVNRYIEFKKSIEDVFVIRDGMTLKYEDIKK